MSSENSNNKPSNIGIRYQGRLRNTFLLVLLPISILLLLAMGGITYLRARNAIQSQVNAQLDADLDALVNDFNKWLTTKRIRLDLLVRQKPFQTALNQALGLQNASSGEESRDFILQELDNISQRGEDLLFNNYFITQPDGIITIASRPDWVGQNISETDYFKSLSTTMGSIAVNGSQPLSENETAVITSVIYKDEQDEHQATIFGVSGSLSMISLLEDVNRFNPGAQSFFITQSKKFIRIDPYQKILNQAEPSNQQSEQLLPMLDEDLLESNNHQHQIVMINSFDDVQMISNYTWLPSLRAGLVVELPEEIAFGELNSLGPYMLAVTLVFGMLLGIGIWGATQRIAGPLSTLTQATDQFAQGNWSQRADESRRDEIGLLSFSFNRMAEELSDLYQSLEAQVLERTQTLERRSRQLEATAQVARQAAAVRNLDDLLTQTTHLISEHFGYYHTGIFLLDEPRKYAVLQAANSEGGQRMLEREHKLPVGQTGVVGYVAAAGVSRIALDVGTDVFYFDNPDLPETRSELALPLKIRGEVTGVLDVQSKQSGAFEGSDVDVLQILADQVALAIESTRLLEQSQSIIHELQVAYGEQARAGWINWLKDQTKAYFFDRVRISPANQEQILATQDLPQTQPRIHTTNEGSTLIVPITLREQVLGSIILQRDALEPPWTSEDLTIVSESIAQISVALDNARLLDDTRRSAAREQLVGEITSRVRETLDIETIAKTAGEEIRKALDLPEVIIRLGQPTSDLQPRS